jgi:hypothetical protein
MMTRRISVSRAVCCYRLSEGSDLPWQALANGMLRYNPS